MSMLAGIDRRVIAGADLPEHAPEGRTLPVENRRVESAVAGVAPSGQKLE